MPSVGRIKKLGVAGVATVILGVSASSASANDVWLWACHGPSGQSVNSDFGTGRGGDGVLTPLNGGCAGEASAQDAGYTLEFAKAPAADGSYAAMEFSVPAGVTASKVRVIRRTHGFGGADNGQRYSLRLDGPAPLEARGTERGDLTQATTFDLAAPTGGALVFRLDCTACSAAADASVDIIGVAFLVNDTSAPAGGVSWNNPVDENMELVPDLLSDVGAGLDRAEVTIEEAPHLAASTRFQLAAGGRTCDELSPGDATVDRPYDPADCLRAFANRLLDPVKRVFLVELNVPTTSLPEGIYHRTVTVYDAAGNASVLLNRQEFEVTHPPEGSATQTLSIGSSAFDEPQTNPTSNRGTGGVAGAQTSACRSPRLSVTLDQNPLRVSKGVPVLRYGKKYRFEGRLTCVVNGKRRSAPKRTRVEILNKVGKRTVTKPATRIADKGLLRVSLKYPVGTRTLIFRFRNSDGQRSQVSIKIKIEKKKSKR